VQRISRGTGPLPLRRQILDTYITTRMWKVNERVFRKSGYSQRAPLPRYKLNEMLLASVKSYALSAGGDVFSPFPSDMVCRAALRAFLNSPADS